MQGASKEHLVKKYGLNEMAPEFEAFVFENPASNGYTRYVMCFEDATTPKIIAHEALHVVRMIFKDRGIEFVTGYNDEHQCYLLGWIVDMCHKYLKTV